MEKCYLALLSNTDGVSYALFNILLGKFKTAEAVWRASFEDLLSAGVPDKRADKLVQSRQKLKLTVDELAEICDKQKINIITYKEKIYPELLKQIISPPLALFVKGSLSYGNDDLAIVGSRKSTSYGSSVAEEFAADLAKAGITVVSGGAKGIDSYAHKGALSVQGKTIAVFGCGIDIVYPKENVRLFEQIIACDGALVSEYLPGEPPLSWHFPMRNRIISGLCKGVLVVEANKKSGSLITAKFAVEENRDVYCVPGSIYSAGSVCTHNLIKQGAMLVDRPEDIISDFNGLFNSKTRREREDVVYALPDVGEEALLIYQNMVAGKIYSTDEIIITSGLETAKVSFALLELELSGLVKLDAGVYQKTERER